jgi:hypothetical protein
MAKIAFILLCHKDPEGIIAQAQRLTAAGDCMAIHFDARAPRADYDRIRARAGRQPVGHLCPPPGQMRLGRMEPGAGHAGRPCEAAV